MRTKRVKRTAAQIAARKIMRDPLFKAYRETMGTKQAYEAIKEIQAIEKQYTEYQRWERW
jgi:tripartite-type tricarboxylate transporter receptor subunit TctC